MKARTSFVKNETRKSLLFQKCGNWVANQNWVKQRLVFRYIRLCRVCITQIFIISLFPLVILNILCASGHI